MITTTTRRQITFLLSWFGLLGLRVPIALARVACFSIFDCEKTVGKASECVAGFCTNPYHVGGCLSNRLENHHRVRTCSSDDPTSSAEKGYCRPSTLGYSEVRVSSQNWESAVFVSWILQILLTELMDVPVTIETSHPDAIMDFYDIDTSFDYGGGNDWDALRTGKEVRDCTKREATEDYVSCSHVIPEVWNGHSASLTKLTEEHTIENPGGLGVIGEQLWFMRRKTARQYLSFVSYLGMQGEENRIQLAEVFKRPTSWDDYCTLVSEDNCQTPDEFSTRPPSLEGEGGKYFVDGSYTGYFRATEQNNCTANPNCTGHIVDYPCGWSSFVSQQTYHLGIALESNGNEPSNGYSYSEMVQIWRAANATDSHVIMQWWKPESLYQEFLGTESEMQGIALPPPTQDCVENRIDPLDRCGDDPQLRIGDPLGSCTEGPYSLMKVISTALYDISFDPEKPEELHSPAYNTIKSFRVSELQLGKIFKYWFARDFDRFGLDPRDATCQWFVENTETLRSFIPRSHPRVIEDDDDVYKEPAFHVALALSCSAIFSTLCASVIVFILRDRPTIRYSQIEFLYLLLIGLLLVSIGSLLTALPPSDQICVAIVWLVNFGYTLELVPLIVKVAAINQFVAASEQMRRVKLTTASLFGAVIFFCLLVCVCLAVWTATDPPRKDEDLELTNGQSEDGVTVIQRSFYCNSEKEVWNFLGVSWQALLLLCASILAFQSRKVREDLNESKTLAMMIYSQTVLVVLRAITYALEGSLDHADVAAARSIIYSFDAIATLVIYFLPKFVHKEKNTRTTNGIPHEEQSPRLNVHKWKFRQPHVARDTAHTATGSGRRGDDDISVSDIHSHELSSQQLSSMQQNSFDFRTNAEWESSGGVVLEAVSEEAHSADSAEDDEPSGTGSVEHTSL